jgi:hypothetical protein
MIQITPNGEGCEADNSIAVAKLARIIGDGVPTDGVKRKLQDLLRVRAHLSSRDRGVVVAALRNAAARIEKYAREFEDPICPRCGKTYPPEIEPGA